jgi:endonuclease YncB( thermonuclease family)
MNVARKTTAAIVGLAAVALLAGCAGTAAPTFKDGAPVSASPSSSTKRPDDRLIKVTKVIDPVTVVATPYKEADPLYGKTFTVHIGDILTPAKGECGYDQAFAFAKTTLTSQLWTLRYDLTPAGGTYKDITPFASNGDHNGWLASNRLDYGQIMSSAGMAFHNPAEEYDLYSNQREQAKSDGTGLWSVCPSFGS